MLRVGIYCRVSTEEQVKSGNSLATQEQWGIQWCSKNDYDYEIFSEQVSGGTPFLDRPEFLRLYKKLSTGALNAIWVVDTDRLIRDDSLKVFLMSMVEDTKCRLFINGAEKDIIDRDRFEFGMLSNVADYYRAKMGKLMRENRAAKWRNGLGIIKTGLGWRKTENGGAEVDESQALVVKDIFKTFLNPEISSYGEVYRKLINKYPKLLPSSASIGRILKDEKYKGIQRIEDKHGEVFEFNLGRIIENDVFDQVQEKIKRVKSMRKAHTKNEYLLKGLVKCSLCNQNLWVRGGGGTKGGKVYWYYKCNEHKETLISIPKLENIVWRSLFKILEKNDLVIKEYQNRKSASGNHKNKLEEESKSLNRKLDLLDKKKNKLLDEYLGGEVTKHDKNYWIKNTYEKKQLEYAQKLSTVEHELSFYENEADIDDWFQAMKKDLMNKKRSDDFGVRRALILKYIKGVGIEFKFKKGYDKYFNLFLDLTIVNHTVQILWKDSGGFAMMYPSPEKEYSI
ncbi:recombinase family protein [Flavobacteriaceae bacterium D16]|nr:recombinase family protein [Flavobacteriaceae bacterium D16]